MEFIDTAYSFLAPFLFICFLFAKGHFKKYALNLVAVINTLLVFYSLFTARQLYALYAWESQFHLSNTPLNAYSLGWVQLRLILLLLLPLFFLKKEYAANLFLTGLVVFLFWCDKLMSLYKYHDLSLHPFYSLLDWTFKILNYSCLLVAGYALLWLAKKLPSNP